MKKTTAVALVVVASFVVPGFLFGWNTAFNHLRRWVFGGPGEMRVSGGPPKVAVEKLNELVSLRVRVGTFLSAENDWYKGIWVVQGDALFGTDCGRAEWFSIDQESKSVLLKLPEPRVIIARVDHDSTRLYDLRSHSLNPAQLIWGNPDELRDEAMQHAQAKVEKCAEVEEHFRQARDHAETSLKNFYKALGWNLQVEWQSGGKSTTE